MKIADLLRAKCDNVSTLNKFRKWGIIMSGVDLLASQLTILKSAMKVGSVITIDKGVLTLAKLAAVSKENNDVIFPILLHHLENCRPKEIPQHSESTLLAVTDENKNELLKVLRKREKYLTAPQLKRVKKIYKTLEA